VCMYACVRAYFRVCIFACRCVFSRLCFPLPISAPVRRYHLLSFLPFAGGAMLLSQAGVFPRRVSTNSSHYEASYKGSRQ